MIFDDPVMNGLLVAWGVLSVAFLLPLVPARRRTGPDGVNWDPAKVPPKLVPQEHWPGDARRSMRHLKWLYFIMPATWFTYYCGFEFFRGVNPDGWLGYVAWWRPVLGWAEHFPLVRTLRELLPVEALHHADRVEHLIAVYWTTVAIGAGVTLRKPRFLLHLVYSTIFPVYGASLARFRKSMYEFVVLFILALVCAYAFGGGWYPGTVGEFTSYEGFMESKTRSWVAVWLWAVIIVSNFAAIGVVMFAVFAVTAVLLFFLPRDRWVRVFGE